MLPSHTRLTRRSFLYRSLLCWSAVALSPLACTKRASCSTFEIGADLPAHLLFPDDARRTSAARLAHLSCADDPSDVLLRFSDGRTLLWGQELSFGSQIVQRGGLADRAAVAPKVVAAYALEGLRRVLRRSQVEEILRLRAEGGTADAAYRAILAAVSGLRRDFDSFQEQAVLDTVTIGAVYDLALALGDAKHGVSQIVWNADDKRFVLDPV